MSRPSAGSSHGCRPPVFARSGDLTRWRLLTASLRVFAEKGFDGAGTREITQEAGVSSALIWFHFRGKEGLYLEALRLAGRLAERLVAALPDVPGAGDPRLAATTALRALSRRILRAALPCRGALAPGRGLGRAAVALVGRELSRPRPGAEAATAQAIRPVAAYLDRCIQALHPGLDEEGRAWLAIGVQSLLLLPVSHPGLLAAPWGPRRSQVDLEAFPAHILALSLHGITPGNPWEGWEVPKGHGRP